MRLAVFTLMGALVMGACVPARPSHPMSEMARAGETAFVVANELGEDVAVQRLQISVDGEALPLSILPAAGQENARVGVLSLGPGEHHVSLMLGTSWDDQVRSLRADQVVFIGRDAAVVRVRLVPNTESGADITFEAQGARLAPAVGTPQDRVQWNEARCIGKTNEEMALCEAENAVADAALDRDVGMLACVREKSQKMRELAEGMRGFTTGSGQLAAYELAAKQMERLMGEVKACQRALPLDVMAVQPAP